MGANIFDIDATQDLHLLAPATYCGEEEYSEAYSGTHWRPGLKSCYSCTGMDFPMCPDRRRLEFDKTRKMLL